jgi:threonine dehydrogenase-like Zn-dependent dehydrogenase
MAYVSDVVTCKHVSTANDSEGQFDVVVDATGSPGGMSTATSLCRPMGKLVLKSTCASGDTFNAAPFVIDELHVSHTTSPLQLARSPMFCVSNHLQIVGSRCGPLPDALALLEGGDLQVKKYVTKTFPLHEAREALKCAAEKSTMKVQIICSKE